MTLTNDDWSWAPVHHLSLSQHHKHTVFYSGCHSAFLVAVIVPNTWNQEPVQPVWTYDSDVRTHLQCILKCHLLSVCHDCHLISVWFRFLFLCFPPSTRAASPPSSWHSCSNFGVTLHWITVELHLILATHLASSATSVTYKHATTQPPHLVTRKLFFRTRCIKLLS